MQHRDLTLDTNVSADTGNIIDPALTAYSSTVLPEVNQYSFDVPMTQPASISLNMPKYARPIPDRLGLDEIYYLNRKGALFVPDGAVLAEMLRCFVEYVHYSNPVIELHDFLEAIKSNGDGTGRVSLLVLQAMLYAASAFVGIQCLRNIGHKTRKEARQHLYSKVKVRR